jgi:DNA-binding SARP family transcriptional activator/pimeloyl-ACP methyl ester carboxylesterase
MLVVRVLGPVSVERDRTPVEITSAKQRLVLAVLAASRGPVSRSRLIDALWPDDPPPSARSTLLGYVSRLRGALGAVAIRTHADGYLLQADQIDAVEFERLAAIADGPSLEAALALWAGDAYDDLASHPMLGAEARRLRELRTQARAELAATLIDAGDLVRPVSMLEALVDESPAHERAWVLLVRALTAAGRFADAARAAYRCRRNLIALGLEPSPELVSAEAEALGQRAGTPGAQAPTAVPVGPVRYVRSGEAHIACQVVGGGPVDLVLTSYGSVSIDSIWDSPQFAAFITGLGASCRVVLYDTRGIGLSDPIDVNAPPTLEEQSDDLQAVLAATGAERAVVVGVGEGGPVAITCAHRHPREVVGLVLINTFARLVEAAGYHGVTQDFFEAALTMSTDPDDGRDTSLVLRNHAPSVAGNAEFRSWWQRAGRRGASPATANALWRVRYGADVRHLLRELSLPTLVVHRRNSRVVPLVYGEHLAATIPGAKFVAIDGADQPPFTEGADEFVALIRDFAVQLSPDSNAT